MWTPTGDAAYADLKFDGAVVLTVEPGTYDVFELHESGVATVTLYSSSYGLMGWVVTSVRYDVVPRGDEIPR